MGASNENSMILIVDDDPLNIDILSEFMEKSGFSVLHASNGQEAIQLAETTPPDLILLDVLMPGIDGFETCKQLKAGKATKEIPVIFLTSLTDTSDKIKGFKAGAIDYITKPFQREEVIARVTCQIILQNQKKELSRLNEMKDQFLSIISFDITGIFSMLVDSCEVLMEKISNDCDDDIQNSLEEMRTSAQNGYKMVMNLLDWSEQQLGAQEFASKDLEFL